MPWKALVILTKNEPLMDSSSDTAVRRACNHIWATKGEVEYLSVDETAPPTAAWYDDAISAAGADMLIFSNTAGGTRAAITNIDTGELANNIPLFILGSNVNPGVATPGVNLRHSSNLYHQAEIYKGGVATGSAWMGYGRPYTLNTPTGNEVIDFIIRSTDEPDYACAWKYSPDGLTYVYCDIIGTNSSNFMLLLQEAIRDGVLEKPFSRIPIFVNIDHWNDPAAVADPTIISRAGDLLRSANAVCYASMEISRFSSHTASMNTNYVSYSDVFKYIACHDHSADYLSTTGGYLTSNGALNNAINDQESKADIDASYQATKTAIEGIGLTVNTDLAHCAANSFGTNFLELAQPRTKNTASADNSTTKSGYGFKVVRSGAREDNGESYPQRIDSTQHWRHNPTVFRGMTFIPAGDGDGMTGATPSNQYDYFAMRNITDGVHRNKIIYLHADDFADDSGGTGYRGMLMYQYGVNLQAACPDVVDWGADVNNYL